MLKVNGLNKNFDGIKALSDFTFEMKEREILGLIGPNGAGKTTFFNVLTGFIKPENGNIIFKNKNITGLKSYEITRSGISRTFQDLRLIRQLPVIDNLLLSFLRIKNENIFNVFFRKNIWNNIENKDKQKASELLDYAGIREKENVLANDLSYGQQKLLSILCCLAADSELLLLDEPIAGINPEMRNKILKIICELPSKGKSVIIIEHDIDFIKEISDKLIFMDDGKKVSEGSPEEVINDPKVIESYLV